ncbi:hypothetical protein [Allosphingosinicella sp.]|uniref:hypothetical protein n=1 Tax=Allosphingosinicella sp. TaxID=2823234 RepID=UPI003D7665F8
MEAAIRNTIAAARAAEREGGWITYLARDPRRVDLKGNPGWPFYVGQSKEYGKRVRNHLRTSEKLAQAHDSVRKRIRQILHDGHVPIFEVLERQPTRLLSLVSETNFARACRRRGYDIANLRRLQNEAGPSITRHDIPTDWLWEFSLEEAMADGIGIRLACTACGEVLMIDAVRFRQLDAAPKDLREIKNDPLWLAEPCTSCGRRGSRFVDLEVP